MYCHAVQDGREARGKVAYRGHGQPSLSIEGSFLITKGVAYLLHACYLSKIQMGLDRMIDSTYNPHQMCHIRSLATHSLF